MPQLIKYFYGFYYQFGMGIGADTISKSKLLPRYHMRISDDYFSGTYKKVEKVRTNLLLKSQFFKGLLSC